MEDILAGIEDLLEGRRSRVSRLHSSDGVEIVKAVASFLELHATAFNQGKISCSRLVEVALPPFLKLARKASQETYLQTSIDGSFFLKRDLVFIGWGGALGAIVDVIPFKDSRGTVIQPLLCLRKRAEFVKALLKSRFPEVGLYD